MIFKYHNIPYPTAVSAFLRLRTHHHGSSAGMCMFLGLGVSMFVSGGCMFLGGSWGEVIGRRILKGGKREWRGGRGSGSFDM